MGPLQKLVNLIKMMQDSKRKVKIQGQLTKATGMERGFRQGGALYTTLLSTVLEKVIRNIQTNRNGTIFNRMRQMTC
jgi:hypothetical protein